MITRTTCNFVLIYIFQRLAVVELSQSYQRQTILMKHHGVPLQDPARQQVHKFQEHAALMLTKQHTHQLLLVVMLV